jgi:(1->4)-alpha-D-glucan 1-alpha-D-glucosylmutase
MQTPIATYRLQLCPEFTFRDVAPLLSYLRKLGISHLYLSPVFACRAGSTHGYDIVEMNEINPELGGREGLRALSAEMKQAGMGWLQDVVPNHRAFHGANRLLMDVLESGRHSPYHRFFDILWDHPYENIRGRVLAPFLGDFYAKCLERGEIRLTYGEEGFEIEYYELRLPVALRTYNRILEHNLQRLKARGDLPVEDLSKLLALIRFIDDLDTEIRRNPDFAFSPFVKGLLWELYATYPWVKSHVDDALKEINIGDEERDGGDVEALDQVLAQQNFRLSYWKVGTEELNYRRFFSINDLICLRVEEEEVFEETHRLLFDLIGEGTIQGIRIDHVDGLYDPGRYLGELRRRFPDLYVIVEKILEADEPLPASWPVQGTTGYDFVNAAGGLLTAEENAEAMQEVYEAFLFTGSPVSYDDLVEQGKRNIIGKHMAGDIDNLALWLRSVTARTREGNDLTMHALRQALVEILVNFPVYRTYVSDENFEPRDRALIARVMERSKETAARFRNELELIGSSVLRATADDMPEPERRDWIAFVMRLQQYTGPLTAKGAEDTAFYVYNRLLSRNEVGCDPSALGYPSEAFHRFQAERCEQWPHTLNASSTHDTKRGEDVRARLHVISENPGEWKERLDRWHRMNRGHKAWIRHRESPSRNDEYFVYQTMLGAAPFAGLQADRFPSRLEDYLVKACREGKRESSWLAPNEGYEAALTGFAGKIMDPEASPEFLEDFTEYRKKISFLGIFNSLAQTLLKMTAPGIPDFYQGAELWDLSLVDPDNRRPVDYGKREEALAEIEERASRDRAGLVRDLARNPEDGRIKLFVIREALKVRNEIPEAFLEGGYEPVQGSGVRAGNVVAFARLHKGRALVAVVTRHASRLELAGNLQVPPETWAGTKLALPGNGTQGWVERFTGERVRGTKSVPVSELLHALPVALLVSD